VLRIVLFNIRAQLYSSQAVSKKIPMPSPIVRSCPRSNNKVNKFFFSWKIQRPGWNLQRGNVTFTHKCLNGYSKAFKVKNLGLLEEVSVNF